MRAINYRHIIMASLLCGMMLQSACAPAIINQLDQGLSKAETVPTSFDMRAPSGPVKYQKGWHDGCESGLASTNQLVRPEFRNHVYTLDQNLAYDPMYHRVWKDAYDYCAFTMLTLMKYNG